MSRKITIKGLIKKNWELCRQIKFVLMGRKCELCGNTSGLQIDHCFSRTIKRLFYDVRNLTVLCSYCHTKKSYNQNDVALRVFELVERREKDFSKLRKIANNKEPFREWQDKWFHEEKYEDLTRNLQELC